MARLIKTVKTQNIYAVINTNLSDGTTIAKKVQVGDVIENLRYVENSEIVVVTGKVTAIGVTQAANQKLDKTNPKDTFATDVSVDTITLDCSEQYTAKTIVVNAKEIVEFEEDMEKDIANVRVIAGIDVILDMTYSNLKTIRQNIQVGDLFENMVIMSGTPGTADITGSFTLESFVYNAVNKKPDVTSLALKNTETNAIVMAAIKNIISFHEIEQIDVDSPEALAEAFANAEDGAIITVTDQIQLTETLSIPAGKSLTIELGDNTIVAPVVDGDLPDIDYALEVSGDVAIVGGTIAERGVKVLAGGNLVINGTGIINNSTARTASVWVDEGASATIAYAEFSVSHVGATSDPFGPRCIQNSGSLTIESGVFESENKRAYSVISWDGDVTINDCDIEGVHGGVAFDGGAATINGGNFKSTEFYGLYVSNDTKKAGCVINGGTFQGKNYAVWVGSDDHDVVDSTVDIYGGTFNGPLKDEKNVQEGAGITVYGGLFRNKVEDHFLAPGYACSEEPNEDGYYEVYPILYNDGE